ncbi:S41 family peptidase [uncultured Aquimarina sp.]|uniref:S41 family peptidase n=1 Tax=uncultured Aquimarina sp. TaxID=575652 RepID=UPI002638CA68|nr:S41 family peptidase [uncultured Aquimarina sp.]
MENKKLITLILLNVFLIINNSNAQNETSFDPLEKFSADSLKVWTKELMIGIEKGHPGFYRYTTKESFDNIIDSTTQTITDSLTSIAYYRKLKPLFAQIGCLHTSINLSESYNTYLDKTYKLLPINIFIAKDKRIFITENLSNNTKLPIRSELITINGKSSSEILETLLNTIPSDGYNETLKILLLNHRFSFWYQSIIECETSFNIQVKVNDEIKMFQLDGIDKEAFPSFLSQEGSDKEQLHLEIKNDVAFLKIRSFAKTTIKENGQNFKKFIKKSFKNLKDQEIKKLVIDLRYNAGGTDGNAVFLASHFFSKPFRYWEKIEVTEQTVEQITGVNRLFYKKPIKVGDTYHWQKAKQTNEFDYYEIQNPAKNNYEGDVYILTNGLCMSSCSDFVAILAENNIAKIVGQETGGGFQGNTSGMMPEIKIHGNMLITIPLQKYTTAVDSKKNFGRGAIPDFIMYPTLDEWITKKDIEMAFILDHLKKD